ncbi:MAG: hypothetical protein V5B38_05035 [Candidatus Accumulibacter propinquus]
MSLIQGTISGLRFASDIAKSFLELKSISDVQGKVIELQSAILSAQSSALASHSEQASMVEEIRTLKEEIARVKAWETQKNRYALKRPWDGATVYALKESMSNGEPAHWICAHCYENGKRSILQYRPGLRSFSEYACPCGAIIHSQHRGAFPFDFAQE